MANVTELRAELQALEDQILALHQTRDGELREFTPAQQTRYDELRAEADELKVKIDKHEAIARAAQDPVRVMAPNVNVKSAGKPWQLRDGGDGDEARGRAVDALEHIGASDEAIERAVNAMVDQAKHPQENNELARRIAVCSSPEYARAFAKLAKDPISGHQSWTGAERAAWDKMLETRAAMAIGSGATGGYAVPAHLDPSFIITNAGTSNVIRAAARNVTVTSGSVWHGVSSDGVTASFDAEAAEVSDDSPTLASPSVTTYGARAFVRGSIEAFDDIPNLQAEILRLFSDAKDRLEEAKFATGTGTAEPKGIFTAIAAVTASRVVSTTAATIGLVDLQAVYRAVPARHRRVGHWMANPLYTLTVKNMGTAVSASYSGDLREPAAAKWLDLPVLESDDAPSTQTTTALDSEVLLGNFDRFVVADRLGSTAEFIPHMFSTSNGRPTGERGMFFMWRTGSDCVDTNAFRLLVDKTSA